MDMNPAYADMMKEDGKSWEMDPVLQKFLDLAMSLTKKELISKEAYDTIKKAVESCTSESKDKQVSEEDPSEMEDDSDEESVDSEDPRVIILTKLHKTLGIPMFKKKI